MQRAEMHKLMDKGARNGPHSGKNNCWRVLISLHLQINKRIYDGSRRLWKRWKVVFNENV